MSVRPLHPFGLDGASSRRESVTRSGRRIMVHFHQMTKVDNTAEASIGIGGETKLDDLKGVIGDMISAVVAEQLFPSPIRAALVDRLDREYEKRSFVVEVILPTICEIVRGCMSENGAQTETFEERE